MIWKSYETTDILFKTLGWFLVAPIFLVKSTSKSRMQICGPSNTHVISLIRPLLSPFPHALCQIMRMAACPIGQSDRVLVLYNHIRAWHDGLSCEETERSAVYHPPTARMQNHRPHTDSFIIYWSCWPWECYEPFMLFTCYLKHYPEWLFMVFRMEEIQVWD